MKPPKVFISYSHDSLEHKQRVLELSERLITDGVDSRIDQYEISPLSGWPRWTRNQIKEADFVLVVCTKNYQRRYEGAAAKGVGAGAKWEGAIITQQLYEAEGGAHKYIPVVFARRDSKYIPVELRGSTYYVLDDEDGYRDLYRHVTNQPKVRRGALGALKPLPPLQPGRSPLRPSPQATNKVTKRKPAPSAGKARGAGVGGRHPLILIVTPEGRSLFVRAPRVEASSAGIHLSLLPADEREAAIIKGLERAIRGTSLAVAFGSEALFAEVSAVRHVMEGGRAVWHLELTPEKRGYGGYGTLSEFSMNGVSPDEMAEMRARRILLNEQVSGSVGGRLDRLSSGLIEGAVRGHGGRLQVTESPFPKLYQALKGEPSLFLAAARLQAVLLLLLTNTVESIHRLELRMQGRMKMAVNFEGARAKRYVNHEPFVVKVKGTCALASTAE